MNILKILPLAFALSISPLYANDISFLSPYHSPFVYITEYIKNNNAQTNDYPEFYFNEGYLNFTKDYIINTNIANSNSNTFYIQKWPYSIPDGKNQNSPDITWQLFKEINNIKNAGLNTHIMAYSSDRPEIFMQFQNIPQSQIHVGKSNKTHGKNMQASNGKVWFSQNGSLNLQTVGETCKANNSIIFVETMPILYNHFKGLWKTIYEDSLSKEFFPDGSKDSSGLQCTNNVLIGQRKVSFYAGKNSSFVGAIPKDNAIFPYNIFPPIEQELPKLQNGLTDLSNVNWYDQIIFDAANLLLNKAEEVNIDIVIFEIGETNQFINNIYRFVKNGFENNASVSKVPNATKPTSEFMGKLNVNLYYQFQLPSNNQTSTYKFLNENNGSIANGTYRLNAVKVWQNFTFMGQDKPKTPQDMHHKFAIITYKDKSTKSIDFRLYITTSNLDTPKVGSGKKWQSGTIITPALDNDPLFRFYENQIKNVLMGQQAAAANNANNSYFDASVLPNKTIVAPGIAAFVFPVPIIAK